MNKKKRILITGASGFVGKALINFLPANEYEIIAVYKDNKLPSSIESKCLSVIREDICRRPLPESLFDNVDVVCHLAAFIPGNYSDINEAEKCYQTNALASLNLASEAATHRIKRFIYVSTANMYSFSGRVATEDDRVFPYETASPYFVSKLAGEVYITHICQISGMTGIILRIATPYGPGEPKNKLIPSFLTQAMYGNELTVYHGGTPRYNFIYIDDITICIKKAITQGRSGIYNVSSGESTTLGEVARLVTSISVNRQVNIKIEPSSADSPLGFPPISNEKAVRTWELTPVNLKAGLLKYMEFIQSGDIS